MGKNIVISVLLVIVLCLGGYLVYDKMFDKKGDTNQVVENDNTETKSEDNVKYKIVKDWKKITDETTCSGEYNETFNNINVKISYSGCTFDDSKMELSVNGEKVKLELPNLVEFAFYDNYLVFSTSSTSGTELEIYDTINKTFIPSFSKITGYFRENYIIDGNKLVAIGRECGEQCSQPSSGYKYAKFEYKYENGKLSDPILVERWN